MPASSYEPSFGALPQTTGGVLFRVWTPETKRVTLILDDGRELDVPRARGAALGGVFELHVQDAAPGTRYRYRLDGGDRLPDPASRYQPDGVHGPSEVVDLAFDWTDDAWQGVSLDDLVLYELHLGTFTPEGTFAAAAEKLPYLADLGVTAIELMPVHDFPGRWNWGYDPASLFAPSATYGRPEDLQAFVDAAHRHGLAVHLDVVYNHLGPDGAYVAAFAPMFTKKHTTPWGDAINLDDEHGEGVRQLFLDNAIEWLDRYHMDGLRLDATHALKDDSPTHLVAELTARAEALPGPRRLVIAEDHRNKASLMHPREEGGMGLDGVWADDFHHIVRHNIAGDHEGYFAHFAGLDADDLARTVRDGWYYQGQASHYNGEVRGTPPVGVEPQNAVIAIQNHDQVGNRPVGARLHHDTDLAAYRAATALLLCAPETPLLFMGQEWVASTPFLFFTDHNEELGRQVSEGRRREFEDFEGFSGEVPDPQSPQTFEASKLRWKEIEAPRHARILQLYRDLLALRPKLSGAVEVEAHGEKALHVRRGRHVLAVSLSGLAEVPLLDGAGEVVLHTEDEAYTEEGQPPQVTSQGVHFSRAGAVLLRM